MFQATNRSSNCQKKGPCRIARALHQIKFELEAPNGADAIQVPRVVGVRRVAAAVDIEEVVGVARIHRALPPTAANLQTGINRIILRHLAFEGLVLGALGGSPGIGCPIGGGGRSQSS